MNSAYDYDQILVLSGPQAVRKRPGMYIGDVHDGSGLHHLLWEVLGSSIDQHLARRVRRIRVDIDGPWVTVADDGPGITGELVDRVFTELHCGATCDGHVPHIHLTNHGVGLAAVNAVCARLEVEAASNGRKWRAGYERGECVEPVTCVGPTERHGVRIRFRADEQIFGENALLDPALVGARVHELAAMNPLLEVLWQGTRVRNERGLRGWLEERTSAPIHSAARFIEDTWVDVALAWCGSERPDLAAFVNTCPSREGTHVRGFWEGIADATKLRPSIARELHGQGLVAILHVGVYDPSFDSPTRSHLLTSTARNAVRRVVGDLARQALR